MTDEFLILHGLGNHRPPQHWQFLLAAALVQSGHHVRYPALPSPDVPDLDQWVAALRTELAEFESDRTTVVCHSLSCLLWFHAVARGAVDPVDRVLLVSPPASEVLPSEARSFMIDRLDVQAVRASATEQLAIVCSDADPYNPSGAAAIYGEPLGVRPTVVPGAGHITPDDGYGPWPYVVTWCLRGAAQP